MSTRDQAELVQQRLKALRMIVLSMGAALPVIGVIGLTVLPSVAFEPAHLLVAVAIGAAGGLLSLLLTNTFVKPLSGGGNLIGAGLQQLNSATFVQIAVAEGSGMLLFALAFVFDVNAVAVLVGMLVSAGFVFGVGWPTTDRLRRVRRRLESGGASCPLDELADRRV